jgi:hypothetical protein
VTARQTKRLIAVDRSMPRQVDNRLYRDGPRQVNQVQKVFLIDLPLVIVPVMSEHSGLGSESTRWRWG